MIRFDFLLIKKGDNMKAISGLTSMFDSLTKVLGGNVPFVGEIASNIIGLVQSLGDAGIVGLIAAIIILNLFK
jgi:hypothetical protein